MREGTFRKCWESSVPALLTILSHQTSLLTLLSHFTLCYKGFQSKNVVTKLIKCVFKHNMFHLSTAILCKIGHCLQFMWLYKFYKKLQDVLNITLSLIVVRRLALTFPCHDLDTTAQY